jgi:ankyrin repeat protein
VHCQLEFLADCMPAQIRQTLDKLPPTLYGTYERTLRGIKDTKWEYARRLLQCVAVASRHLRVEELAEILAFDFEAGPIPKFREDWRLNNPVEAVLSTCSTLLSLVNVGNSQVIQFAHFSVKEFLMSTHLAEKRDMISHRYHISMLPAHTLVAQVCLGILLHLDKTVSRDAVENFPLARYAAEHWFTHARFEGVSQNVDDGMKQLFDRRKPHLAVWLWICDPTVPSWNRRKLDARPLPPSGTPLHYAAFCGLHDVVNALAIEHSQDVNSRSFTGASTPLYLASGEGHVEVSRILLKHGADAGAQNDHGSTPLHQASEWGHVELARVLIEHHAHTAAQDDRGWTPLRLASERGDVELARLLIEHGADAAAQDEDGWTPLHLASERGEAELARLLVEHDADVAAQDEDGWTPLHLASYWGHLEIAQLLVEHDANPSAQDNGGWTPLHRACKRGEVELARLLIERGADTAAQDDRGWTPLHLVSERGDMELARLLVKHGADIAAKDRGGRTPLYLYLASKRDNVDLARLLEHGADAAAQESRK